MCEHGSCTFTAFPTPQQLFLVSLLPFGHSWPALSLGCTGRPSSSTNSCVAGLALLRQVKQEEEALPEPPYTITTLIKLHRQCCCFAADVSNFLAGHLFPETYKLLPCSLVWQEHIHDSIFSAVRIWFLHSLTKLLGLAPPDCPLQGMTPPFPCFYSFHYLPLSERL